MSGNWINSGFFGYGFFSIFIIIAIFFIILWLVKPNQSSSVSYSSNGALDTLKMRLAKGEMTEEEYDRLRRKIEQS